MPHFILYFSITNEILKAWSQVYILSCFKTVGIGLLILVFHLRIFYKRFTGLSIDSRTGSCEILRKTDFDDEICRSFQGVKFLLSMEVVGRKAFGFTKSGWWMMIKMRPYQYNQHRNSNFLNMLRLLFIVELWSLFPCNIHVDFLIYFFTLLFFFLSSHFIKIDRVSPHLCWLSNTTDFLRCWTGLKSLPKPRFLGLSNCLLSHHIKSTEPWSNHCLEISESVMSWTIH